MTHAARGARFCVYTRESCALCDEFIAGLTRALEGTAAVFEVVDVDADPATRRRFGRKVPVLTCAGRMVCYGHLDQSALARLL